MDLELMLRRAVELGASDIHLKVERPPIVRRDGSLGELEGEPQLTERDLELALEQVCSETPKRLQTFLETGELDSAYAPEGLPRFRVNGFRQRGSISIAFRVIPREVPDFGDLSLPAGVRRLAEEHRGLVLVTGATGSGKTTTLAAVIDHINRSRRQHIVTIEDPIEIVHGDHGCIVNQREVGLDTASFAQALRRGLRQDPDVILIGELRDAETAETALAAAESGHLVLSTMHTVDASETIGRMVEFFPAVKQPLIRSILAGVLRGVVSQRLLPRIGGGRIPAVEIMIGNARIADLIRDNKPDEITEAIAEGDFFQMQTFSKALIQLVLEEKVDREVAANAALESPRLPHRARPRPQAAGRRSGRGSRARAGLGRGRRGAGVDRGRNGRRGHGAAETPRRRPAVAMRRLLPLLAAVLALAASSTGLGGHVPRGATARKRGRAQRRSRAAPRSRSARRRAARCHLLALRAIWQAAGNAYAIPWPVLGAINKVETNFGQNLGPSSAGAVGWMQFMPSTWARWGIDANGDGVADPNNPTDAIFSAARYLVGCGGQFDIARAVYCYNHSHSYVSEVLGLAALYGSGGGSFTGGGIFSVDLQPQLDSVRKQIAGSKTRLAAWRARKPESSPTPSIGSSARRPPPHFSRLSSRRTSAPSSSGSADTRRKRAQPAPAEPGHRQHSARQAAGAGEQPDVHPGRLGFRRRRRGQQRRGLDGVAVPRCPIRLGRGQLLAASTARVSSSTCSASSASRCRTTLSLSGTTRPPCRFRKTRFSPVISSSSTGSTTSGSTSEADTSSTRRIPAPTFASTASARAGTPRDTTARSGSSALSPVGSRRRAAR